MKDEISSIKNALGTLSTTYKQLIKSSKNQVKFMAILMKIDSDLDEIEDEYKLRISVLEAEGN